MVDIIWKVYANIIATIVILIWLICWRLQLLICGRESFISNIATFYLVENNTASWISDYFRIRWNPPTLTILATAAGAPLPFFDLENLLGLRGALCGWVVDLIDSALAADYLVHLVLGDKASVVPKAILGQVFATWISYMLVIHPLLLFLPVLEHAVPPLFCG